MPKASKIIVIDVEATCMGPGAYFPEGVKSEIISVGICQITVPTGEVTRKTEYLVRPEGPERISSFCTELTGLTWEKLKFGRRFEDVCRSLANTYGTRNTVWGSYGEGDREIFERQCREKCIYNPFGSPYFDIATLAYLHHPTAYLKSLQDMVKIRGLEWVGTAHNAADDAHNAANILSSLLGYPAHKKEAE